MRRWLLPTLLVLALVPGPAAAKTTTWNMAGVAKLEGWNHKGFSRIELTPAGLLIQTDTQGQLAHAGPIRHNVDTVTITYSSPTGAAGIFFWQTPDQQGNQAYNIPMQFSPSATSTSMVLDLTKLSEWTPKSKLIGFNFNPGSQIVLQKIEFNGPGLVENVVNSTKSVFVLDTYRGYSVNFLWGPRMVGTADALPRIFAKMPPLGTSWNKVFYAVLLLALAGAFVASRKRGTPWLPTFMIVVAACWIVYDVRMGAEIISYAKTDWNTWWSKPIELQDFRDRSSFTAFTKVAKEYAEGEEAYALITPTGWPYFGAMTYETYPARPLSASEDLSNVSLWFIYNMKTADVDSEGRLTVDGEPLSPPGQMLLRFEPGAFIFRVNSQ